jgi:Ca2+-binding RTX toxin-like protein
MGSEGSDTISGGDGNDVLYSSSNLRCGDYDRSGSIGGGNGNDLIIVASYETGSDITSRVEGGAGDDDIRARNGSQDTIDCGDGTDKVASDAMDTVTDCEDASTG